MKVIKEDVLLEISNKKRKIGKQSNVSTISSNGELEKFKSSKFDSEKASALIKNSCKAAADCVDVLKNIDILKPGAIKVAGEAVEKAVSLAAGSNDAGYTIRNTLGDANAYKWATAFGLNNINSNNVFMNSLNTYSQSSKILKDQDNLVKLYNYYVNNPAEYEAILKNDKINGTSIGASDNKLEYILNSNSESAQSRTSSSNKKDVNKLADELFNNYSLSELKFLKDLIDSNVKKSK